MAVVRGEEKLKQEADVEHLGALAAGLVHHVQLWLKILEKVVQCMHPGPPTVCGGAEFLAPLCVRTTGHAGPGVAVQQLRVPVQVVLDGPDQGVVLAGMDRVH